MRLIKLEATVKTVVSNRIEFNVQEIESFQELKELPIGQKVVVYHNCDYVFGNINVKEDIYVSISDRVSTIIVRPKDFCFLGRMFKVV